MKSIITIVLLLAVGQVAASEQLIDVQHDSARGVTCWILNNTGISCLPDSSLLQATPASEAAQASQAAFMCQNEQLPATLDERFQL